jgi:hypothetical protein
MGQTNKPSIPTRHNEVRDLLANLMERVAQLEAEAHAQGRGGPVLGFSDEKLGTIATSMYRARIHRANQFNPDLFGEPAWDMLLDLFIHRIGGRRVSTTSLCMGGNVPQSTGLRHIARLEEEGLVVRWTPPDDQRLVLVDFTPNGFRRMRDYISNAVTRFVIPMPD